MHPDPRTARADIRNRQTVAPGCELPRVRQVPTGAIGVSAPQPWSRCWPIPQRANDQMATPRSRSTSMSMPQFHCWEGTKRSRRAFAECWLNTLISMFLLTNSPLILFILPNRPEPREVSVENLSRLGNQFRLGKWLLD
jgi:hypothetical protein